MNFARFTASLELAIATASGRGYNTIPLQKADWQRISPNIR